MEKEKSWIKGTFLDTMIPADLSTEPYHVLRGSLSKLLSPIEGLCTGELVHDACCHRYGTGYTESMDCRGVQSMSQAVLNLGMLGHVPNDVPETLALEGVARELASWFLDAYWSYLSPDWLMGYGLQLIGSFPCDTKVGGINEFDYLCVLNLPQHWWEREVKIKEQHPGSLKGIVFPRFDLEKNFHTFCKEITRVLPPGGIYTPRISDVYRHGPATTLDINWTCMADHEHELSIDVSLATEHQDDDVSATIRQRMATLPKYFHSLGDAVRKHMFVRVDKTWDLSSCTYDRPLFDVIERHVTSHIRAIYRCVKVLTKHILPHQIQFDARGILGYKVGATVSSHGLKCLLFEEVHAHPNPADWVDDELPARLVGILRYMTSTEVRTWTDRWPVCHDFMTGNSIKSSSYDDLFRSPSVIEILRDLQETFHHPLPEPDTVTMNFHKCYLKSPGGHLHPSNLCKEIAIPFDTLFVYGFVLGADAPYRYNPLIRWCYTYIHNLYLQKPGVELYLLPEEDLHQTWILLHLQVLTPGDVKENHHMRALETLRHYMDKYQDVMYGGDLWDRFIYGQEACELTDDVRTILDNASVGDLETILACGMYEEGQHEDPETTKQKEDEILMTLGERGQAFRTWINSVNPPYLRYMACVNTAIAGLIFKVIKHSRNCQKK